MMLLSPEPVATVAELAAWAVARIRYGHGDKRWLIAQDERGCWLVHREKAPRYSRDRRPREDRQRIAQDLHARLAARWPRARNEGLSYLTAAGVVDLVSHSGPVKAEAKRLRALDDARAARRLQLEIAAEEVFRRVEGVPGLEASPDHTHRGHGWFGSDPGCRACARARAARRRADDRAGAWLRTPLEQLGGRRPDDVAEESDEGLAQARFALQAVRAPGPTDAPAWEAHRQ